MKEHEYNPEDRIAALATPWGTSAIAVIRAAGTGTIRHLEPLFRGRRSLSETPSHSLSRGTLAEGPEGVPLDDVLAAVYRPPHSYTGEESVELFVHGSPPGIQRILETLRRAGFRQANRGEFTFRAFLNGKLDLTRAEAVHEVVTAKSGAAQSLALARLSGAVAERIDAAKGDLLRLMGLIELQLDYSEDEGEAEDRPVPLEEIDTVIDSIRGLSNTYSTGRLYREGIRIALAGRTNAGKSSLFNLFLREDRSIVSEIHGTTRDYIESWINLGGIPGILYDTAGMRTADHPLEAEGIRRTEQVLNGADVVLYLVDAADGETGEDAGHLELLGSRAVRVWNKIDTVDTGPPEGYLPVSAVTGEGFKGLEEEIKRRALGDARVDTGEPVIDSMRQKRLLDSAVEALENARGGIQGGAPLDMIAPDVHEALQSLGEITGEVTREDILDEIFSNFCVGK
jgi:tRNA modification GTPase